MPSYYCTSCGSSEVQAKRTYTPDFFIFGDDGKLLFIIEVKGIFTVRDRKIADAMRKQHPGSDIRYLFYFNNKLNKNSKTRYTDWCDKRDLLCGTRSHLESTLRRWTNLHS